MPDGTSESSTSKVLAIVTAIVAVAGLAVSAWSVWYATSSARADSIRHDHQTAATECRRQYLERCDALNASVREAIVSAQKSGGVDAPMTQVRIRVAAVAMFLDPDSSRRLKESVEQLDSPPSTAPLQLLNNAKDEAIEKENRKKADDIATVIELLLAEQRTKTCQPS